MSTEGQQLLQLIRPSCIVHRAYRAPAYPGYRARKEAYLKATGEGLIDELPAIEVTLAPGEEPQLLRLFGDAAAARQWTMRAIPLPAGFAGAVAFETSEYVAPNDNGE